jgi:allantoinase
MREKDLEMAMREIARLDALLVVQAEWPDSTASEAEAVRRVVRLCRETGARVHFLRLSRAEALEPLERARSEGLPVTAETCPPHLALGAEVPPSGENENRDRLWEALGSGVLDMVVSGHASSRPGCSLPVVWTEARRRGYSLSDLARWMSSAPARLARLETWKGSIAPGQDADLVVFDPEAEWSVGPEDLRHRHKLSPYAGKKLRGLVAATYLKGEKIWEKGRDIGTPAGELLLSAGGA